MWENSSIHNDEITKIIAERADEKVTVELTVKGLDALMKALAFTDGMHSMAARVQAATAGVMLTNLIPDITEAKNPVAKAFTELLVRATQGDKAAQLLQTARGLKQPTNRTDELPRVQVYVITLVRGDSTTHHVITPFAWHGMNDTDDLCAQMEEILPLGTYSDVFELFKAVRENNWVIEGSSEGETY